MEIVAHRGLHHQAPENSLAAIEAAIGAGCAFVEVDLRMTADGRLVLLHDAFIDRTTGGSGAVAAMSADAVSRLRLRDGSRVPFLEDAADIAAGRATLCLDVKDARAAAAVADFVRGRPAGGFEVWSELPEVVAHGVEAGAPGVLIASGVWPRGLGPFLWAARRAGARRVSFYPADLEAHVAAACHHAGLAVQSGTPNDAPTWRALARLGVAVLITDRPVEARRFFERGS